METIFFSLYFPLAHLNTSAYLLWAVFHCNLWNNFASNTPQTCRQSVNSVSIQPPLVYELLSILSLCLPSLRTERPNIHTGLKSSLEGRAALKSSFQFGQHPLLYFANFVCTPPLPFPPSLFILWFRSAFLLSIHGLFILSFFHQVTYC